MAVQNLDVAIGDLDVGKPLDCDVLDASGIVLLRKGLMLTQEIVDGWTRRGFARVLLRRYEELDIGDDFEDSDSAELSRPYDPLLLKELNQCFLQAKQAVDEIIFQLTMREEADTAMLESVSQTYLDAIESDIGVVLYNAATQKVNPGSSGNKALATRSVQMAMLGAATAATLGLSRDECHAVSMAGLLHDISLFEETLALLQSERSTPEERRDVYFRHSLHSAELFSRSGGVSDLVRVVISQVHEQIDGSGFPRGVPGQHLNTLSRILNIVDAYLTLIEPTQSQPAYVPSDAIAYLVSHTAKGAFDRDCMKAFLTAVSIYAVGSKVELDDSRTATILRSSRTDPLRPIVRIDDASESIIDLRRSKLNVIRPAIDTEFPHRRRLPKAQMQSVLWKPLY
ncbi:MAG: HD-GYP domain-containing protein [Aureliella sp.]|jgi:HD-GYP domain-containing protein (c-di-GMP phosphodiesterase class II)